MKILFHHRTAAADGQLVHILELVRQFEALGHQVIFVGPGERRRDVASSDGGNQARRLWPKWLYEPMELGYSLPAFLRLWRACWRNRPDVLYERYNLYFLAGLWVKRLTGVPLLLEVNAPLADERERFGGLAWPKLARWAERTVWRGADQVLPVTEVLASHVAEAGVPAERIAVIHNGAGPEFLDFEGTCDEFDWTGKLVLGFTGFVRDWHGLDRVVRFLAGDAPAETVLVVVGDGPAREDLARLAADLGVADRVYFTGVVGRADIPAIVASFDIALQPAVVSYASPLKLFEYMALGRCVVAPATANVCEVLSDGVNAVLFDPDSDSDFRRALDVACESAELRDQMGHGARQRITDGKYLWSENARRIVVLAEAALAEDAS